MGCTSPLGILEFALIEVKTMKAQRSLVSYPGSREEQPWHPSQPYRKLGRRGDHLSRFYGASGYVSIRLTATASKELHVPERFARERKGLARRPPVPLSPVRTCKSSRDTVASVSASSPARPSLLPQRASFPARDRGQV